VRKLTKYDLALKDDDERLVLEGKQILRVILNDARHELERQHVDAQKKGQIIQVTAERGAIEKLLRDAAKRELEISDNTLELEAGDVSDNSD
jgi:hypothetical protein